MKLNIAVAGPRYRTRDYQAGRSSYAGHCTEVQPRVHSQRGYLRAIDEVGDPFPEETFKTCMDADAVLCSRW